MTRFEHVFGAFESLQSTRSAGISRGPIEKEQCLFTYIDFSYNASCTQRLYISILTLSELSQPCETGCYNEAFCLHMVSHTLTLLLHFSSLLVSVTLFISCLFKLGACYSSIYLQDVHKMHGGK